MRFRVVLLFMVLSLSAGALEAEPVAVFEGDGLKVVVNSWSETNGDVAGEIRRGEQVWPFAGTHSEDADGNETVRGTFKANDAEHAFTTLQKAGSQELTFRTGKKTYTLRPVEKPAAANPLDDDEKKPAPKPQPKQVAADVPDTLKLKLHVFPDISMGVPAAYAVTLPEGWKSKGNIEWSQGELSFPQPKFEIVSPKNGRIRFIPAINLSYTESKGLAIPPQGVRAPEDFPQWFVGAVQQTNKAVSNVELVTSRRDEKAEAFHEKISRETGANDAGMRREVHVVTFEYDEAGVRRREEATLLLAVLPPIDNVNIFAQTWAIYTSYQISAPAETFEAQKKELYTAAGSVAATPAWFMQSQALIAELSRIRTEARWAQIRKRGQEINQRFSDAEYKQYKEKFAATSDSAQRDRINTIYETDDFRDTTGEIVNLPMHYQHVYSDGKGNYVLTNNTQNKPGELWNEIQTIK